MIRRGLALIHLSLPLSRLIWELLRLIDHPFRWLKPRGSPGLERRGERKKKADEVEHPGVFDRVGLLVNEPPGQAGLPFI
jgi:hypothetical protein